MLSSSIFNSSSAHPSRYHPQFRLTLSIILTISTFRTVRKYHFTNRQLSGHIRDNISMMGCFFIICLLHSAVAITCGGFIMFYLKEISVVGHGAETARKLMGSTPHDELLIQTSGSFAGLLLVVIGYLLFMVAFVKDREFQSFFARGFIVVHFLVGLWRVCFERRVEELANDWPRQLLGDFVLALSWLFFLVYSWREKYD